MPVSNISREKCANKTSTNQTSDCVSRCVSAVDWSESTGLQNMYQFFSSSILLLDHTQNDRKCFNVSNPKTCQNIHIHTSANKLLKHQMFYQPRLTSFSWSVFSRGGGSLGRCTAVKTREHTHTHKPRMHTHIPKLIHKTGKWLVCSSTSKLFQDEARKPFWMQPVRLKHMRNWHDLLLGGSIASTSKVLCSQATIYPTHVAGHQWIDQLQGPAQSAQWFQDCKSLMEAIIMALRLLGKSVLWKKWQGLHVIHFGHFGRLLQVVFSGKLEKGKQAIRFQIWPLQLQPKFFSEFWANHWRKFFGKTSPLGFVCPATKDLFDTSSPQCSLWKQPVCWKNSSFIFANFFGYVTHHPSSCFRPLLHLHPEAFARHHGEYIYI